MSCHAELRIMQRSIPIPVDDVEAENLEPAGIPPLRLRSGRNDKLWADLSGERLIEFRYGFVEGLA